MIRLMYRDKQGVEHNIVAARHHDLPEFHVITTDDGKQLCVHRTDIRIEALDLSVPDDSAPDVFGDIVAFHKRYGIDYDGPPRKMPDNLAFFRDQRLKEEMNEYWDAKSDEERLDSLVDLIYIALGTCHLQGWLFNEAWRRVHFANMQKERHSPKNPSKYGFAYDVVKPKGWKAPSMKGLVAE